MNGYTITITNHDDELPSPTINQVSTDDTKITGLARVTAAAIENHLLHDPHLAFAALAFAIAESDHEVTDDEDLLIEAAIAFMRKRWPLWLHGTGLETDD